MLGASGQKRFGPVFAQYSECIKALLGTNRKTGPQKTHSNRPGC